MSSSIDHKDEPGEEEEMKPLTEAARTASIRYARFMAGDEERQPDVDYSKRVVLMCALAAALSYCDRTNMSVAIVSMSAEMHWSDHQKSLVLGAFFWGYLLSQFAGSMLSQKYGGRQVLGLAAVSWSLLTWFMPTMARVDLTFLVFGRFLLGVTEGVTFPAIYYLLRQYVPQTSRSRSVAAISIGTMLGAVMSFLLSPLLVKRFGWESVFTFFGGFAGPTLILLWFRYVPSFKPEDAESKAQEVAHDAAPVEYLAMLREPVLLSIFCAHFAHNLCHFALMSWLPIFLNEQFHFKGDSLAISALPWLVMVASVTFSSTLADHMVTKETSDISKVRRLFTVASFSVAGIAMFAVALFSSYKKPSPSWTLFFLCIALSANGCSTSGGYEAAKLDLSRSAPAASRLQSLSNTLATLAGVVGIPLVPLLKGADHNWARVFEGLGVSFFVGAFIFHKYGRWNQPLL